MRSEFCQRRLGTLQLGLPVTKPLPITVEELPGLLEAAPGLLEIALQLSPAFLGKTKRLLNPGHFATNRVVLFLGRIQRISGLALL